MKSIKRILACVLTLALIFSFAGCHKQGEIAISFGDVKFTSAVYSLALLNADSEARSLVDEALGATTSIEPVDYLAQTVEGKPYAQWVEETAKEELSKWAAYRILCKENGVEIEKDVLEQVDAYVEYYYPQYEALLTANGIGKTSYREMELSYAYSDAYFNFLYGEGGSKEVPTEELKKVYDESYRTAFLLYSDLSQFTTEEEKNKEIERLNGFKKRIDDGEDIVKIYNEFNKLEGENAVQKQTDVISILADAEVDANYGFDDFDKVKEIKPGETAVINQTSTEEHEGHSHTTSYYFVVKVIDTTDVILDEEEKTTFFDSVKDSIRYNLKEEEFNTMIEEFAKTLTPVINKRAIKPFTVDKITYPEQQQ